MHQIDPEMKACMDACHECHVTCLHMAMNHCLEAGGRHAEPQHMKIMADCAQICAVAIDFMARKSEHHRHICRECAEICRACASSCEGLDGME
ncbi:MAG: ferredoxin, partial [Rhizobium sp.]